MQVSFHLERYTSAELVAMIRFYRTAPRANWLARAAIREACVELRRIKYGIAA